MRKLIAIAVMALVLFSMLGCNVIKGRSMIAQRAAADQQSDARNATNTFYAFVQRVLSFLLIIEVVVFAAILAWTGIGMTHAEDQQDYDKHKTRIKYSVFGFVIVVLATLVPAIALSWLPA
jgi:hypothetical protein